MSYKSLKSRRKESAADHKDASTECYREAMRLADDHGMILRRLTQTHYHLRSVRDGWLLNIYPGDQRLGRDVHLPQCPTLNVPQNWTVLDVVKAAVELSQS